MTSVYHVTPHSDRNTLGAEETSWHYILNFSDAPAEWRPIEVWDSYESGNDFMNFSHRIASTTKARAILELLLNNKVRFYLLRDPKKEFWMTILNNSIDCLDFDHLEFTPIQGSKKLFIRKYAFIEEIVRDELLFTTPVTTSRDIFATGRFKRLIEEEYKLTGLEFKLLWNSKR